MTNVLPSEYFANQATTSLNMPSSGITTTPVSGTVETIAVNSAAGFPTAGQYRILVDTEIMIAKGGLGTTSWSVVRGAEGTTTATHLDATTVTCILTRDALNAHAPAYNPTPRVFNLIAWTYDPAYASAVSTLAPGSIVLVKMWIPQTVTLSNAIIDGGNGSGLTTNQNLCGVYNSSGALIGKTADQSVNWLSSGYFSMPLTVQAGQSLTVTGNPDAFVWLATLVSGTTGIAIQRPSGIGSTLFNLNLSGQNARSVAYANSGQTSLPLSFTPSSLNGTANGYWAALS